jgi:hypothetical protein
VGIFFSTPRRRTTTSRATGDINKGSPTGILPPSARAVGDGTGIRHRNSDPDNDVKPVPMELLTSWDYKMTKTEVQMMNVQ